MDAALTEELKQGIVAAYGPWTAHNIHLGDDVFTMGRNVAGDEVKLRRISQVVNNVARQPIECLRILDLACLEGLYAVAFAQQGAAVVAIEGRKANLAKAQFARFVLSLNNLTLLHEDVRGLHPERHGHFDVVLCLGILYHLDTPDVFTFLRRIAEVCQSFAVIDTHVSLEAAVSRDFEGRTYWGNIFVEHPPDATPAQKLAGPWASLDNDTSFWLTRSSLYDALSMAGFTSVFECHIPAEPAKPADRVTLVAMKGQLRSGPE